MIVVTYLLVGSVNFNILSQIDIILLKKFVKFIFLGERT